MNDKKRLIVLSSPSGGGKTTVAKHLMKLYPELSFSISATTRQKRPNETYGVDYFFLEKLDFEARIKKNDLIEYEEIFGNYYGTLKSEIDKNLDADNKLLFDVDVKGAISLKNTYPEDTLLIFLMAPESELEKRLRGRSTETEEEIQNRLSRAKMEMEYKNQFDYIIINDILEETFKKAENIAKKHISI